MINFQECQICLFTNENESIKFNEDGVCTICTNIAILKKQFTPNLDKGSPAFSSLISKIKSKGNKNKYDCLIGVSGGTDSSYLLHLAKSNGLRPLAFHYDNTWNSAVATMNIEKMLSALEIDLVTFVMPNKEADDIFKSAFLAGIPELDSSTDLAYAYLLRRVARQNQIKYILEGHSFIEEGITPLGRNYFDGRYIKHIHDTYGSITMKSYPLMTLRAFLFETIFGRVKFIRPLWFIRYEKESAKKLLNERYDWVDYGGHHLENRLTTYLHSEYLPRKFKLDLRINVLSAQIRSNKLSKQQARELLKFKPYGAEEAKIYFQKRLNITKYKYEEIMNAQPNYWTQFKSYRNFFVLLRPLFFILLRYDLITRSFYLKYCFRGSKSW